MYRASCIQMYHHVYIHFLEFKNCVGSAFQWVSFPQMAPQFFRKCDRIGQQYQWQRLSNKPIKASHMYWGKLFLLYNHVFLKARISKVSKFLKQGKFYLQKIGSGGQRTTNCKMLKLAHGSSVKPRYWSSAIPVVHFLHAPASLGPMLESLFLFCTSGKRLTLRPPWTTLIPTY